MKHDEKKIEEAISEMSEWYEVSVIGGEPYKKPAFIPSPDHVRDKMKQYAEHMRESILNEIIKYFEYGNKMEDEVCLSSLLKSINKENE